VNQSILHLINQEWQHPFLDWLMVVLSALSIWMPFFVVGGIAVAIWGGFRGRAFLIVMMLTIALGDGVIARYGKKISDRPRPHQLVYGITVRSPARTSPDILAAFQKPRSKPSQPKGFYQPGRSFPSAHTINVFAAASVTVLLMGTRWLWLYLIATAVAYSRIYVGDHWPGDLPISIVIGITCGFGVPLIANTFWRKWADGSQKPLLQKHPSLF